MLVPITALERQTPTIWYAVQCQTHKEHLAAAQLHELHGISSYVPELRLITHAQRHQALFPGYIFIQQQTQLIIPSQINTTPYVIRLVSFGGQPQAIPHSVIEQIQQQLHILNAQGGFQRFQPGDHVKIIKGPFQHLQAIFQGPLKPSVRVTILLECLGGLREIQLPRHHLEASEAPIRRERRTRGRGRPIKKQAK
jgi:transcriptional antiterminator RfaH